MDITNIFRSRVDFVKNRTKALGDTIPPGTGSSPPLSTHHHHGHHPTKSKLFPGKKSEYYSKAKEITSTISSLKTFLTESRSLYLSINSGGAGRSKTANYYRSPGGADDADSNGMSEGEKDQVDSSVQKIIQNVQKKIFELRTALEVGGIEKNCPQLWIHMENVINSLVVYLKEVCEVYSEMRAIRVKRAVDIQAMAKISHHHQHHNHHHHSNSSEFGGAGARARKGSFDSLDSNSKSSNLSLTKSNSKELATEDSAYASYLNEDEELSPEELQLFDLENAQLLNNLNTLAEEADQIETSVVKIAQLQEIFTEKVLLQDKEISSISNVVIGTTENIKGGNEQIRQAIQQNADFRAWVMFFIIVMSLSLLFLDWYNE